MFEMSIRRNVMVGIALAIFGVIGIVPTAGAADEAPDETASADVCPYVGGGEGRLSQCLASAPYAACKHDGGEPKCVLIGRDLFAVNCCRPHGG